MDNFCGCWDLLNEVISPVAVSHDSFESPRGRDVISLQEHNPGTGFIGFGCVLKHLEFPRVC